MKKALFISFLLCQLLSYSQEENKTKKQMQLGFQLAQYQNNFGLGLNLSTPFKENSIWAFRIRGNVIFNEYVKNFETEWTPYSNVSFGVISGRTSLGQYLKIYGEGGAIALFPSNEFSSENLVLGGYGLFGFEFMISKEFNYFIELGGVGTSATADKVVNQPIYSNGFLILVGFRINFID